VLDVGSGRGCRRAGITVHSGEPNGHITPGEVREIAGSDEIIVPWKHIEGDPRAESRGSSSPRRSRPVNVVRARGRGHQPAGWRRDRKTRTPRRTLETSGRKGSGSAFVDPSGVDRCSPGRWEPIGSSSTTAPFARASRGARTARRDFFERASGRGRVRKHRQGVNAGHDRRNRQPRLLRDSQPLDEGLKRTPSCPAALLPAWPCSRWRTCRPFGGRAARRHESLQKRAFVCGG